MFYDSCRLAAISSTLVAWILGWRNNPLVLSAASSSSSCSQPKPRKSPSHHHQNMSIKRGVVHLPEPLHPSSQLPVLPLGFSSIRRFLYPQLLPFHSHLQPLQSTVVAAAEPMISKLATSLKLPISQRTLHLASVHSCGTPRPARTRELAATSLRPAMAGDPDTSKVG
jgi:hypothetical protein